MTWEQWLLAGAFLATLIGGIELGIIVGVALAQRFDITVRRNHIE